MNENRIVVGFDGSPMSAAALRWAAAHSRLTGSTLLAVHTWQQPSAEEFSGGGEMRHLTGHDAREDADSWLAAAIGPRSDGLLISLAVIEGPAGPVLVERARDAALLVVGTGEHTGLRRLVSGSVSHYCLSHARCPVVAVPGPVTVSVHERKGRHEAVVSPGPLL